MWKHLNRIYHCLVKKGIPMPLGYDPVSGKPSLTITFAHFTFTIAVIAIFRYLRNAATLMQTIVCIGFWSMATVFYLVRQINKAKFNLEEKSFEVEGGDSKTVTDRHEVHEITTRKHEEKCEPEQKDDEAQPTKGVDDPDAQ